MSDYRYVAFTGEVKVSRPGSNGRILDAAHVDLEVWFDPDGARGYDYTVSGPHPEALDRPTVLALARGMAATLQDLGEPT